MHWCTQVSIEKQAGERQGSREHNYTKQSTYASLIAAEVRPIKHGSPSPVRDDRVFNDVAAEHTILELNCHTPTFWRRGNILKVGSHWRRALQLSTIVRRKGRAVACEVSASLSPGFQRNVATLSVTGVQAVGNQNDGPAFISPPRTVDECSARSFVSCRDNAGHSVCLHHCKTLDDDIPWSIYKHKVLGISVNEACV